MTLLIIILIPLHTVAETVLILATFARQEGGGGGGGGVGRRDGTGERQAL